MRVLLTGANGFIGSHILEALLGAGFDVTITLRASSNTRFIEPLLPRVEVRTGSLDSVQDLDQAVRGADVVVHCAGKTKAVRKAEYHAVNAEGTRRLVEACNRAERPVRQLIFLSSLTVSGPGVLQEPAQEESPPGPVTAYGRSKLVAEDYVRTLSRVPYTILRPAGVYGPRDRDFYMVFKAVRSGLVPLLGDGSQPLSLIYVSDVARAVVQAIGRQECLGRVYHLAHAEPATHRVFLAEVAAALGRRPVLVRVPRLMLYPACLVRDLAARITGRPSILNLEKIPEYMAAGWVCSTARAERELGFVAATDVHEGVMRTAAWYRDNGWLPAR